MEDDTPIIMQRVYKIFSHLPYVSLGLFSLLQTKRNGVKFLIQLLSREISSQVTGNEILL